MFELDQIHMIAIDARSIRKKEKLEELLRIVDMRRNEVSKTAMKSSFE